MTTWSSTTLVRITDGYDREFADNGSALNSRLGNYLKQHLDGLWDEERRTAEAFVAWAWSVATSPIMEPGYVVRRPDLGAVRLIRSQYDGRLLVEVETPIGHGQLAPAVRPPHHVRDWEADRYATGSRQVLYAPEDEAKPALLLSGLLRLPAVDWPLPTPAGDWPIEELLIDDAKNSLAVAVEHINRIAGPQVAKLIGDEVGHW